MIKNVTAHNVEFPVNLTVEFKIPSICPHCGRGIDPKLLSAHYLERDFDEGMPYTLHHYFYLTLLCTACEQVFLAQYCQYCDDHRDPVDTPFLMGVYPTEHATVNHPDTIITNFPRFVKIYNESVHAEESQLLEICGMGYRKALEFLVKDFAIQMKPDSRTKVEESALVACINNHINNPKIQALAKASAWLGNDQTHYIIKHDSYGIKELKAFIAATENFIASEMEVLNAQNLINTQDA